MSVSSDPYISTYLPRVPGSPTRIRITADLHCYRVRITRGERYVVLSFPRRALDGSAPEERRQILSVWHRFLRRKLRGVYF